VRYCALIRPPQKLIFCSAVEFIGNFFAEGGRIRGVPVTIGGSSYIPPLPNEADVKDSIQKITEENDDAITIAIKLCLYSCGGFNTPTLAS